MNLNETHKTAFEQLLQDKLESVEYSYNPAQWKDMETRLGSSRPSFWKRPSVVVPALCVIIGASILGVWLMNEPSTSVTTEDEISTNTLQETIPSNTIIVEQRFENEENNDLKKSCSPLHGDKTCSTTSVCEKNCQIAEAKNANSATESTAEFSKEPTVTEQEILPFTNNATIAAKKLPSAKFKANITEGCIPLNVIYEPAENCDSMIYLWDFGDGGTSTEKYPEHIYTEAGNFTTTLTTKYYKSEELITNVQEDYITVKTTPKADFQWERNDNSFEFNNLSEDSYIWEWQIGKQKNISDEHPSVTFERNGSYNVKLEAKHLNGCVATAQKQLEVKIKHTLFIPQAFSPNGDGKNETFGPVTNQPDLQVSIMIYNRHGLLVFESNDFDHRWDGKIKGTNTLTELGVHSYIIITKDKYGNQDKRTGAVIVLEQEYN